MRMGSDGHCIRRAHAALCPAMSEGTSPPLPRPFLKCHRHSGTLCTTEKGLRPQRWPNPCQQEPKAQILVKQKNILPWGSSARHLTQGSMGVPGSSAGSSDFLQNVSFE